MGTRETYQFPFSRYPAVRIALLVVSGVLFGEAFSGGYYLPLGIYGVLVVGLWILKRLNPHSFSISMTQISNVLILGLILVFAWTRTAITNHNQAKTHTEQILESSKWEAVSIRGVLDRISYNSSGRMRADLTVLDTKFESFTTFERYKSRILFRDVIDISKGDTISFSGTIIPISEKRNPYAFDYATFLEDRDIFSQIRAEQIHSIQPNENIISWSWWQKRALKIIERNFKETSQPVAKALLLGYKQDLDSDTKQAFARAGLSHIMAVSGLHVGFIIAPFWFLIPNIRRLKFGKEVGLARILIILFCYAGITGFSPSVVRASVTTLFLSFGKLFNKSPNSINLTAAAAALMLIIDPKELFDIGFQLSFSAVFIILLILPVIQNWLPYWVRLTWYAKPLMVVIVSLVVQFGLYPLQVYYFGEISLVSPLANAFFVPLLGILVPLAFLGIFLTLINPLPGIWAAYPVDQFLELMNSFVLAASNWNWAWVSIQETSALIFPLWLFLIFTISGWRVPEIRWKTGIIFFLIFGVIQFQSIYDDLLPSPLMVTYFDVGQGDAALIQTPNGANILVDTGIWSPANNSGRSVIIPHLKEAGAERLDAIILSHPHADHIGGILELIDEVPIDAIYNSGYSYESNLYRSYLNSAESRNIPVQSVTAGDILSIDDAVLFLILGPEGGQFNSDPNQHSVVMEVIYGETEFLFVGDAGESQELRILENYGSVLDTDALKVGHHGSRTSSESEFLKIVTPDISIISLGQQNRFNHPHPEAIQRLNKTGTEIYYTSRDKAVILKSDGKKIWREKWK